MIDIIWGDHDSVTCPHCHESWSDLWDYGWTDDEEKAIECPHCDAPLTLHRDVSVDYGISVREVKP